MNIITTTKLNPEEAVKQAVEFFGPDGLGLKHTQDTPECAYFEGTGGSVNVSACVDEKQTLVELESREWDSQVKEFIGKIH